MWLPVTGDDIAGPLRHHRGRLEIIGLYQKTLPGIDVAPHVSQGLPTDFTDPRHERLGVKTFRYAMAPGQRVQGAQVVGHERSSAAGAGVAGLRGQLRGGPATWMTDAINVFEARQVVAVGVRRDQVAATFRTANGRGEGGRLGPWIIARSGVARDHEFRNEMTNLGRGFDCAAEGRAEEPETNADDPVGEAIWRQHRGRDAAGIQRHAWPARQQDAQRQRS